MDVIVIGAGAAGLMAAMQLSREGYKVMIVEARDRTGGRINTIGLKNASMHLETGAEFVHGKLELTLKLLKEAGISYNEIRGDIWQVHKGNWKQEDDFIEGASLIMDKLKELKTDVNIAEFLNSEFGDEHYASLRKSLLNYIEGYYAGEPNRTSAKAFYREFQSEDEEQFRVKGGYEKLVNYLLSESQSKGSVLKLSTAVTEIKYNKESVEVVSANGEIYEADKVIVTVPLGIWNAGKGSLGAISFTPHLPEKFEAAGKMGFGAVIKIQLFFKKMFWQRDDNIAINNFGFAITDSPISTWWTQLPTKVPLLTGWIAGPKAFDLRNSTNDEVLEKAFDSLSIIFSLKKEDLKVELIEWRVFNWTAEPFTRGGYSYSTTETNEARKVLKAPVDNKLFFAGEALYDGTETGTVEAALVSGQSVAAEIANTKAKLQDGTEI